MRRDFNVLKDEGGFEAGDEYAASKATALAQLADAPTIEKFVQAIAMMEMVGGQFYCQAVRAKFDADNQLIPDERAKDTPGRWQTVGYVFRFETFDAGVMAQCGKAFVVPGPIEVKTHDGAELANNAAIADGLEPDEREAQPEPEPASAE